MNALRPGDALREQFARPLPEVYRTGFAALDRNFDGGLRAGETTLVGGFFGMAKSAFVEQLALEVSKRHDVLYLPLELGEDRTRARMGAKIARCSVGDFMRSGLDDITRTEFNVRKLTIFDPPSHTIELIEKAIARGKHRVVVIDHVRHIDGVIMGSLPKSRAHEIGQYIPKLARRYGVHIVEVHQLDPRTRRLKPADWSFQDSSTFEQAADNVITTFRPYYFTGGERDMVSEIRIRKNRNGRTGKLHYRWVGETMSFWELNDEELANLECCGENARKRKAKP